MTTVQYNPAVGQQVLCPRSTKHVISSIEIVNSLNLLDRLPSLCNLVLGLGFIAV